jgi:hypothetical protein
MSVYLYDDAGGRYNSDSWLYLSEGYTRDLANYPYGDDGNTWDNDVSSFWSDEYLTVFEGRNHTGDSATFSPGFYNLDDLYAYGISNDEITSLV